jgi:DNA polymerase-1
VVIVSSDKDMMQIVSERVSMLNPAKDDEWYDPAKVKEFLGVTPAQVADLFALRGDAVDNIPGAPGIGDKGARDLIERFGSVEAAIERAAEVERKMYRESLQNNVERIMMSKRLATIDTAVPIEFDLESVRAREADPDALKLVYKELEFHSLLKELGPSEDTRTRDYQALESGAALAEWLRAVPGDAPVAVAVAESRAGELDLDISPSTIGVAWSSGEGRSAPLAPPAQMAALRPWLEDAARPKIACDVKSALLALDKLGVQGAGFEHDIMLYAFLLDADPSGCPLEEQARRRLDLKLGAAPEQSADITLEIYKALRQAVVERGFEKLYSEIELPLARVLARMERVGVRIDRAELGRLSELMERDISRLTAEVHALAGKPFNISSPQQLGRILFEDLGLPAPVKYGKGKTISTAADVLEELAADHEIVRKVLEYRQLTKLKGTYVDALPLLIDAQTGRLHTSFNHTGDGKAIVVEPEPAEYPDPHGAGARDPGSVRAAGGMEAGGGGLFSNRAAPRGAHVARCGAGGGVPERRRHPHAHGRGGDGGASADGDAGGAAQRQGGELRDRVWDQSVWAGGAVGDHAARGAGIYRKLLRPVCRRAEVYRSHQSGGPAHGRGADAVGARAADSGYQQPQSERARVCGAHGGEFTAAGDGGGFDQAGDGAHRSGDGAAGRAGGHAAAGA